jgi:hypothetical protein
MPGGRRGEVSHSEAAWTSAGSDTLWQCPGAESTGQVRVLTS